MATAAIASVSLRFNRAALTKSLTPMRRRLEQPFVGPLGRRVVTLIRSSVRREFTGRFWLTPSGGRRSWARTHDFGRRARSRNPLRASGAYYGALMGGPGAIERITARQIVVGAVSSYGPFHRGGSGATISLTPLVIKPRKRAGGGLRSRSRGPGWTRRWAMFWRLGLDFGVWLKESTLRRGLRLPRRPHMTRNPELERAIRDAATGYILKGKVA